MAHKPKKRVSRMSQSLDFQIHKGQLSDLEKEVQDLIDGLTKFLDTQKSKGLQDLESSSSTGLVESLSSMRQYMRTVRRWRNGSADFSPVEWVAVTDTLHGTYVQLLTERTRILTEELKDVEGFIPILDEPSNELRQNVDVDLQNLEKKIVSLQSAKPTTPPHSPQGKSGSTGFGLQTLKEVDSQISDVEQSIKHL